MKIYISKTENLFLNKLLNFMEYYYEDFLNVGDDGNLIGTISRKILEFPTKIMEIVN